MRPGTFALWVLFLVAVLLLAVVLLLPPEHYTSCHAVAPGASVVCTSVSKGSFQKMYEIYAVR
jgi:hypothetical protein